MLSNHTRKLLWFEITKMLIAVNLLCHFLLYSAHFRSLLAQFIFRRDKDLWYSSVIPKLWPAGHFWPAASYKMARQDLWSRIFYLNHISV